MTNWKKRYSMKNKEFYNEYIKTFLEQNSKLNLISKNDEKFLWEKHVYDSLSIEHFFKKYPHALKGELLDFGTGGGFPSVPIALTYPELKVTALDSIRKKINAVSEIKDTLHIENLYPVCERVENLDKKFNLVTTRAVASLDKILQYAIPKMEKNGWFIAYKSLKANEEIEEAEKSLKRLHAKIIDIITYELPLAENHTRNLIIIKRL